MQEERFDLIVEEDERPGGVPYSVVVSVVLHVAFIIFLIKNMHPTAAVNIPAPIVHYVELMRQNPHQFIEAPGAKIKMKPSAEAPTSDANRRAASPEPTGDKLTTRPGDGSNLYTPPTQRRGAPPTPEQQQQQPTPQQQAAADAARQAMMAPAAQANAASASTFRQPVQKLASAAPVNWNNAIREVVKSRPAGNGEGFDLGQAAGGEKGYTAEAGPLSFETQWFDWGDYAESMVSKIRINWYGIMPELIRTGLKGVVTIRFTIHRDGHITDITILKSSGVPPYDNAAAKALEASSPLKALPADFPKDSEHVTAMFYYNMEIPGR
ncbi:MAG TPA: energy transducer TonB [Thermoanaerobaculia bacterium]|nr:energy transducer TonB [Thermoanaerobaculia bacterium]